MTRSQYSTKKYRVIVMMTKELYDKIQKIRPDHLTRSAYIEDCIRQHLVTNGHQFDELH